jgi:hypothetical protein
VTSPGFYAVERHLIALKQSGRLWSVEDRGCRV